MPAQSLYHSSLFFLHPTPRLVALEMLLRDPSSHSTGEGMEGQKQSLSNLSNPVCHLYLPRAWCPNAGSLMELSMMRRPSLGPPPWHEGCALMVLWALPAQFLPLQSTSFSLTYGVPTLARSPLGWSLIRMTEAWHIFHIKFKLKPELPWPMNINLQLKWYHLNSTTEWVAQPHHNYF